MADEDDHVVEKVALCPSCKQEVAALFISDGRFLCPRCARPNEYKLWKDILDAGPRIKSLGDRLKALEDRVRNDPFVAARRSERQGQRHYPPTPRRWFQFHLATLVCMTIASGTLLYLNICHSTAYLMPGAFRGLDVDMTCNAFGWPIPFFVYFESRWKPYSETGLAVDLVTLFAVNAFVIWIANQFSTPVRHTRRRRLRGNGRTR